MKELGRYRIQSVAEMTGVSAATLRAWERRYGIPAPQRTASAYRLYTDRDVELIRRVRELGEKGIAPAQAAQMLQASRSSRDEAVGIEADTAELAVRRIVAGVERFDPDTIEAAVRHAMYVGPATTLFERVYGPVLAEVGARWRAGTMSIGQEHMVSEIIGSALRDVLRITRPVRPGRTAVLACFDNDEHALPVLGAALTLSAWNIRPVLLGARTPPSEIRHAVAEVRPDLVGLSVTTPVSQELAGMLFELYADACGTTPWLVGGRGAAELRAQVEAHGGVVAPADRAQLRELIDRMTAARVVEGSTSSANTG